MNNVDCVRCEDCVDCVDCMDCVHCMRCEDCVFSTDDHPIFFIKEFFNLTDEDLKP